MPTLERNAHHLTRTDRRAVQLGRRADAMHDCLVIGAGASGSATAYFLAQRGVRVLLVDSRDRSNVGTPWLNSIERRLFRDLELGAPPRGVIALEPRRLVMIGPRGGGRRVLDDLPTVDVDIAALNRWLLALAEEAGVETRFRTRATIGQPGLDGREVSLAGTTVRFGVVVDATGGMECGSRDRWRAYQGVYEITDRSAMVAFRGRHGLQPGDALAQLDIAGGYSTLRVSIDDESARVSVLAGAVDDPALDGGGRIVARFVNANKRWIGRRLHGGPKIVPLLPRGGSFVDDGLAWVGNAAGQVLPQYGAGVSSQIRAADHAANAIAAALQLGDVTASGLWAYNQTYQPTCGAPAAMLQPLRLLRTGLTQAEAESLHASGLLRDELLRATLDLRPYQHRGSVDLLNGILFARELAPIAGRLARSFRLARRLRDHLTRFPRRGPLGDFPHWERTYRRLIQAARKLARDGPYPPDQEL